MGTLEGCGGSKASMFDLDLSGIRGGGESGGTPPAKLSTCSASIGTRRFKLRTSPPMLIFIGDDSGGYF